MRKFLALILVCLFCLPGAFAEDSVEVAITPENWNEYFELAYYLRIDPFGELYHIDPVFCIREEHAFNLDLSREFSVSIGFDYTKAGYYVDSFDPESHSFELGKTIWENSNNVYYDYVTIDSSDMQLQQSRYTEGSDVDWGCCGNIETGLYGKEGSRRSYYLHNYTVTNAAGALFLFEE